MLEVDKNAKWEWISRSPAETDKFGQLIAGHVLADDVICLDGDLGAGKTALTRGIAAGLGLAANVVSPTFTILAEYSAGTRGLALYHFDAYRLTGADDFYANGFDEYLSMGGLSVIEWGKLISEALPGQTLYISLFQISPDLPEQRKVVLEWPLCLERLSQLEKAWKESRGI